MTWDAKPDSPEELKRIRMAGGVVCQLLDESGERVGAHRVFRRGDDVLPGLAMSRSLGDLYAHSVGVTSEPALSTYCLGKDDLFLVLGTDGLWDIMSNGEVVDFIDRYRRTRSQGLTCAEALTLEAQERWKARHEEALVDDISVAIIHTAPLPPVDSSCHGVSQVYSPLAHAASCNDEANALFNLWAVDSDRNPSHHAPRSYFEHLYTGEEGVESALPRGDDEDWGPARARDAPASPGRPGLGLRQHSEGGGGLPAPPAVQQPGMLLSCTAPTGSGAAGAAMGRQPPQGQTTPPSPPPFRPLSPMLTPSPGSAAVLAAMALQGEPSPRSSLDYSDSDPGQSGRFGSSKFSGAFARSPSLRGGQQLGSSVQSSPIPCKGGVDSLFRPIRKAYPSQSGGLCSFKSDASILCQDTPRSMEEGGDSRGSAQSRNFGGEGGYEGKLRGGLPRTTSAPILAPGLGRGSSEPFSRSYHAISLDDRSMSHLMSSLSDSPTDSALSSPYPTISPVGPPMVGAPHPYAPCTTVQAVHVVNTMSKAGGVGPEGGFPAMPGARALARTRSEAAAVRPSR